MILDVAASGSMVAAGDVPVTHLLGAVAAALLAAKLLGELAERVGQPAVIGELLAGVLLGPSILGLIDPTIPEIHLLAEAGVIILLFTIGLETDLKQLLRVGGTSTTVAVVGVVLPFAGGYLASLMLGLSSMQAVVMGAALTATSVGITARVLGDLGQLKGPEGQVILGAAVIDDVIGLIILAVVSNSVAGAAVGFVDVLRTTASAFGFLIGALLLGRWLARPALNAIARIMRDGGVAITAVAFAFALALLAEVAGSAPIIGAFAAGLIIAPTPQAHAVEKGTATLGEFFVPIFFVSVGAAVDVRTFASGSTLLIGGVLLAIGILGKVLAGYAPWWFRGRKLLVGVGMVPRGEVGLIFATMGLTLAVLDAALFSALAFVVFVTTFLAPPLLKLLSPRSATPSEPSAIADLVSRI